jgi:glycosyltransferase involved in cell wall biosynthesis
LTSLAEGGANVVTEALAASVPVVSSRIPGSIGILGAGYPGFFPAGDTRALADLLHRVETDPELLAALRAWCARRRKLVDPRRERRSFKELLDEVHAQRPKKRPRGKDDDRAASRG